MKKSKDASLLLFLAERDLKALKAMIVDTDSFSDEIFGFHAQQALEKSLKAWIASLGGEYPPIHNLGT